MQAREEYATQSRYPMRPLYVMVFDDKCAKPIVYKAQGNWMLLKRKITGLKYIFIFYKLVFFLFLFL